MSMKLQLIKTGKPSRMNQPYQQLRAKDIYKGKGIEVLNIYGDLKMVHIQTAECLIVLRNH